MFRIRPMCCVRPLYVLQRTTKSQLFLIRPLPIRAIRSDQGRRYVNGLSGNTPGQIAPPSEGINERQAPNEIPVTSKWMPTAFKMFESAATTLASILVLA